MKFYQLKATGDLLNFDEACTYYGINIYSSIENAKQHVDEFKARCINHGLASLDSRYIKVSIMVLDFNEGD